MSLVLLTSDKVDERTLVHYRRGGEKKGVRRYQYEDGSLTPLGRIHYGVGQAKKAVTDEIKGFVKSRASKDYTEKAGVKAEIYKARSERQKEKAAHDTHMNKADKADEHIKKAAEFDEKAQKYLDKQAKLKERDEKNERSNAEIKKDVEDKVKAFNEKVQSGRKERAEQAAADRKRRQEEIEEIRSLTDMELNKRIDRLQRERTYAELVNQRANYEKSPFQAKAAKIMQDFAENFARKALNRAGDEVLNKLMNKGKNGNNTDNKNDGSKSKDQSNSNDHSGYGERFSKSEKSQIKSMAGSGKGIAEIAKSLGVSEDRVKGYMASAGINIDKKSEWKFDKDKVTHTTTTSHK